MSHNPHRNHHQHSISDLKRLASGRWQEILTAAGLPAELLDRRGRPCPKCGGRDRFASMPDLDDRGAVHCRHCFNRDTTPRAGDGLASLQWWLGCSAGEAINWLRSFLGLGIGQHIPIHPIMPTMAPSKPVQSEEDRRRIDLMARAFYRNLKDNDHDHLATQLGVSSDALRRLRVGWNPAMAVTSWPMRDADGNVIGIRTRDPKTSAKRSVGGSVAGLFYDPDQVLCALRGARVWVCEGATDTAALLTLGLIAIGCPSAGDGAEIITAIGRRILPSEWVVVADADDAGIEGAKKLRSNLSMVAPVRIITPPLGVKDVRAWLNHGVGIEGLESKASEAEVFNLEWNGGAA